ncbi:unnamed protein product [Effrenium voratum]|nr:unnamed protein product [Effrenium voratum]
MDSALLSARRAKGKSSHEEHLIVHQDWSDCRTELLPGARKSGQEAPPQIRKSEELHQVRIFGDENKSWQSPSKLEAVTHDNSEKIKYNDGMTSRELHQPAEDLVLLTVAGGRPELPGTVPRWLRQAVRSSGFVCATRSAAGAVSVFIGESFLGQAELPAEVEVERDWASLRCAPAHFSVLCQALEEAKVEVNAVSSPRWDWVLMPRKQLPVAVTALVALGHAVKPAARLGAPLGPLPFEDCRSLAGLWVSGDACRLQAPGGAYVDLPEGSCGVLHEGRRRRLVALQPPVPTQPADMGWAREVEDTAAVVLELVDARQRGLWIFLAGRFARVVGLQSGLIAGCFCSSRSQLEKIFGELREELRDYEVTSGFLRKPGVLEAELPEGARPFLDLYSGLGGSIEVTSGEVLHRRPEGVQRWRVVEWGFDPFTVAETQAKRRKVSEVSEEPQVVQEEKALEPKVGQASLEVPQEIVELPKEPAPPAGELAEASEPLPADFKFPQGYPPPAPLPEDFKFFQGYPPPAPLPEDFKFPAGYPPPAEEVSEEERKLVLSALALALAAGHVAPNTRQAIVVPGPQGLNPVVLSTSKTALENLSPHRMAEALDQGLQGFQKPATRLPPAAALAAYASQAPAPNAQPGLGYVLMPTALPLPP